MSKLRQMSLKYNKADIRANSDETKRLTKNKNIIMNENIKR